MNKELLTLITDKIERNALRIGAHRPKAWRNHVENEYCVFSRIKSIRYKKIYHVKGLTTDYDHSISYDWKELFGPGQKEEILCGIQDEVGNWHYPMDNGQRIHLWHPSQQSFQEAILFTDIHWRPIYDYTSDEVIEALKFICQTFNLEFSIEDDGHWMSLSCGHGGITIAV